MHKVRQVELSCILREPQGIENQYDMITTVAGVRESRGRLVLCRTECTTLAHVPDVLETERRIIPRCQPKLSSTDAGFIL